MPVAYKSMLTDQHVTLYSAPSAHLHKLPTCCHTTFLHPLLAPGIRSWNSFIFKVCKVRTTILPILQERDWGFESSGHLPKVTAGTRNLGYSISVKLCVARVKVVNERKVGGALAKIALPPSLFVRPHSGPSLLLLHLPVFLCCWKRLLQTVSIGLFTSSFYHQLY